MTKLLHDKKNAYVYYKYSDNRFTQKYFFKKQLFYSAWPQFTDPWDGII